jgi:hypothetical protein
MNQLTGATDASSSRIGRLRESLRNRDWTGILIEFVVVTLGVWLAFEIDQWGQDRRQANDERQFLERMWRESANISRESAEAAEFHNAVANGLFAIYRDRQNATKLQRSERQPGGAGCQVHALPSQGDTNAQELLASGRLNLVTNPALREQLRELAASQVLAAEHLAYARQFAPSVGSRIDPYLIGSMDEAGGYGCRVRWSDLFSDTLATLALVRAIRVHVLMADVRGGVRDRAASIHHELACALKKPTCRKFGARGK